MKPPGKTTLDRMLLTAHAEMERIEINQDARVQAKQLASPMPREVARRDDFAGIVRLIQIIRSDEVIFERLKAATERASAVRTLPPDASDRDVEVAGE